MSPPELNEHVKRLHARALAGEAVLFEARARRQDGSRFDIETRGVPILHQGQPHVLYIGRDITARKTEEELLRASEQQYRAIFDASADALVLWDSKLRRVDVNPAYERIYGFSREEVLAPAYAEQAAPEYAERRRDLVRRTLAGERCQVELESARKDGTRIQVEVRTIPIQHRGRPHVLAISRDITERKRAEAAVRASEEQYRAVFNASVDGMLLWDAGHRVVDVNDAFVRMHGYGREEVLGQTQPVFIPGDLQAQCAALLPRVLAGESCSFEGRSLRKDGSLFDVEMHGVPMHYQGRPHVLVIVRDVTSRRQAEDRLRASEERYRLLFEMESDAIVLVDVETLQHLDVNRAAVELYGYSRGELLALKSTDLSAEDEKTRSAMQKGAAQAGMGFVRVPLRYHRKKDGTVFPVEITANFFALHGRRIMLAAIRGITERKQAEEARAQLEAQLRQAQKMEAIGQLTGGVAHDFNNILQSILGNLTLAGERVEELADARLARYLERAQLSAQRARELIQQMLTFSRGKRGEPRLLPLAPLVAQAVKLLRPTLPSTIEVRLELDDEAPPVKVDPVQAEQVLLNLCINARDAMSGAGTLALAVRHAPDAQGVCAGCRQRFAGRFVELAVRDTGSGIAPEIVDRMFEPFFSTKEVGKGSGMGLSMVHGIVHEHGGHVSVESAPGEGAAFRVLLPEALGVVAAGEKRLPPGARPELSGRVLVVDDEQMILEVVGDLLAGWGLEVTLKSSGVEAKHAFAAEPQRYDLVLTDYTMPRVTGLELARQIRGIRPGTPVVLYTGYGEDIAEAELAVAGVRALARKPVEPAELFALLKTHLIQSRNTVK
jgi:PAS domain S-box-containing protein